MSDVRPSFPSTEDGSQVGVAIRSVVEGDSVAAKNAQLAFAFKDASGNAEAAPVKASGSAPGRAVPVLAALDNAGNLVEMPVKVAGQAPANAVPVLGFKDSSGNLVYPQLNAAGQLPVTTEVSSSSLKGRGENATGSASLVTIATITLTASKTYRGIELLCSCFRDALFQVIQNDNAVLTNHMDAIVGSGAYTTVATLEDIEFTAGATGTQQLLLKALNNNALSGLRGTIVTNQLP